MPTKKNIRVRFAPSPTGFLHLGGLRMALYDYLFAAKHQGTFVLRIEDTDQKRFVQGALENALHLLDLFGLKYEEGPVLLAEKGETAGTLSSNYPGIFEKGEFGPYIQSERLELYKKEAEHLIKKGVAYYCFCSEERLRELREKQMAEKKPSRYDRHCLTLSSETIEKSLAQSVPRVVRLRIPDDRGEVVFHDLVRGEVKIHSKEVDDQVLLKSDGFPTYHMAVVVDDHLMEISQVIRGEEWLSSTPKHILLYEAFGWDIPEFAHLPLILNPDKSKLSKRKGDSSVDGYLERGYLKEALLNFVAFLGWNPGKGNTQEIYSLEELVQAFDLGSINKAGAVFDTKKLDWMNRAYIMKKSPEELLRLIRAGGYLEKKSFYQEASSEKKTDAYLQKVITVEQERLNTLFDIGEANPFFFQTTLSYSKELLTWKDNTSAQTEEALEKALTLLSDIEEGNWQRESIQKILFEAAGEKRGDFLWPLRAALTGLERSPSPMDVAWVLGKDESLRRIQKAIESLQ